MNAVELQKITKNLYDKLYTEYYGFSKKKKKEEELVAYWKKILKEKEYSKYKGIESYIKGSISSNQKEYKKAEEYFKTAIKINSQIAYPYNSLGIVYVKLEDHDKAIMNYKRAIELDDKYVAVYNNLGLVYKRLEDYDKAILNYNKAIELDDKYVRSYYNLGIAYENLEDYDKAIINYNKAIELDDKFAAVYNNLGFAYRKLEDYDKAIINYNKAIELDDTISFYYYSLAATFEEIKNFKEAEENFKISIEKEVDKHKAYKRLMSFYMRNDLKDEEYISKYKKTIGDKVDSYDQYLLDKLDKKETSTDKVVNEKFSIEKKIKETDEDLLNGFIIFIDLCNSTSFKQKMKEEWYNRLIHFYKSSEEFLRATLKEFDKNINLLKYIGDEVMFFIEDKSHKDNPKFLKAIATYLNSVRDNMNTVYFINNNDEKNMIAYEKNDKKIDIKTCITYVEKVKKYKINDSQFDILGTPVDFSARLMSLCKENIIVCNHDFVELFTKTNYSKDFKNLGKFDLRGFDDNYEKKQDVYIYDYNNVMSIIDNKYLDDNSEIKKDLIGRLFLKDRNIR